MKARGQTKVEVAIRVRPIRPEARETQSAWRLKATSLQEVNNVDSCFAFDSVYGPDITTRELYEGSVQQSVVRHVALGFNGTALTYGQTGSGKTYTMFGDGTTGLVSYAVRDLYHFLGEEQRRGGWSTAAVFVSVLEIYNEQLRDLMVMPAVPGSALAASPPALPLSIRENAYGTYVHNATRRRAPSAQECLELIYHSSSSRVTASTAMNEHSSRSHCVIQLHVERITPVEGSSDTDDETTAANDRGPASLARTKKVVSSLNLVDLAGSERVAKTGAVGVRMTEGGLINKSLSALTLVIHRLTEAREGSGFVPYRDSKLTHLLKSALGGNAFTSILCCVTPAVESADETRSTCLFAARAKLIQNHVHVNENMKASTRIRVLERELRRVKQHAVAQTLYLWAKQTLLRRLQDRLMSQGKSAAEGYSAVGISEQQRMIVEELRAQNESLQEELAGYRLTGGTATSDTERGCLSAGATRIPLDQRKADGVKMVRQSSSLAELEGICKEFEAQNRDLQQRLRSHEEELQEADQLLSELGGKAEVAKRERALVQRHLQDARDQLLNRYRGDAAAVQAVRLRAELQDLQVTHMQLKAASKHREAGLQEQLRRVTERLEDAKDEKDELLDRVKVLSAYLHQFLNLASLSSRGHVLETHGQPVSVCDAQVARALEVLSPHNGGVSKCTPTPPAIVDRVKELERALAIKNDERDVIIDTKLHRMQDLVMHLYAVNNSLTEEMRLCYRDNRELYQLVEQDPTWAAALSQAGLFPRSLQSALERSRFAKVPERPLGHN